MKRLTLLFSALLFFHLTFAQWGSGDGQWRVEFAAGTTSFQGDLVQGDGPYKRILPAAGVSLKYRIPTQSGIEKFELKAGFYYGRISGNDAKNSDPELRQRNLNFKSRIVELNLGLEYTIIDMFSEEGLFISPYIFAGVGLFNFNPYTRDAQGDKYFLRPLCTEGQGLAIFPGRKKYKLTQFQLPFAVGVKVDVGNYIPVLDGWIFSYEFMYHHTFTDYLDDVSQTYVPLNLLSAAYGPKSAELSFRENNSLAYFNGRRVGEYRGNPNNRDLFFYNTFKMATTLNWNRSIGEFFQDLFYSY